MSADASAGQAVPEADGEEARAAEGAVGAVSAAASDELLAAAEAVLVVSDEPVTAAALGAALGLEEKEAEALLEALAAEYRGEAAAGTTAGAGAGTPGRRRGFILRRVAGGWRLASAPEHAGIVESFVVGGAAARLSQAALETLAVIAYRQPVTRGRIAAIRGVNVDGVVRTLHARGLIEEAGNETSGAILYRTTNEFLEYLGIDSLDELPPLAPHLPDASQLEDIEHETETR